MSSSVVTSESSGASHLVEPPFEAADKRGVAFKMLVWDTADIPKSAIHALPAALTSMFGLAIVSISNVLCQE